ncbi:GFA family protein [Zavarzinia compransoris]|uniref:GFA family protein n=1 Tax=Zavarzinia marina TaxID=2911065 RepID=UPI001F3326D7|nr:GFA family protein [Zavarzinia marina]MCF4164418.1 GFA family protein [Zavarzinia marina]
MTRPITPEDPLTGACLCGAVRYRITAPPSSCSHCHCTLCRKASAAGYVTWATVAMDHFHLTGEVSEYAWSPKSLRQFCARCGSQITFRFHGLPGEIDFTCATLDEPERVTPEYHTWVSKKLPWIVLGDDHIPHYEDWGVDTVPEDL